MPRTNKIDIKQNSTKKHQWFVNFLIGNKNILSIIMVEILIEQFFKEFWVHFQKSEEDILAFVLACDFD